MIPYRIQLAAKTLAGRAAEWRGMAHIDAHDPRGTVLLAGSGRSGTTWLGQIINHGRPYREVFEPFHPGYVSRLAGFPVMRYLAPDDTDAAQADAIRAVLAGRVRCAWTDRYNRKTFVNRRLIKAIRANLLLGWVHNHCPGPRLLLAMRHPCAVAHSRLKLGWDTHLDELLDQPRLVDNHLAGQRELIERVAFAGEAWDRHVVMWCIENLVPLRQLRPGGCHVLQYERFCSGLDDEAVALFAFLGRPVPRGLDRASRKRSAHFRRDSAILRGGDLIGDWQSRVSTAQIDRTLEYLNAFGLNHLYDEHAMPRCGRDQVFIDSTRTQALRGAA